MGNKFFKITPCTLPKTDSRYIAWKKSLMNRPPPWNKGKTKDNDPGVAKISKTFRRKGLDNFRKWREEAYKNNLIPNTTKSLIKDADLAFLIGLVLGDGNICQVSRTECLNITLGTDKPKLWKYAKTVVEGIFNKIPTVRRRKDARCVDIRLYQNNLSKRLGISKGKRKNMILIIPTWIQKNRSYLTAYIKGLFEAEGYFSVHKKTYTHNLSFTNMNISLLNQVEESLLKWGFHPERRVTEVRLRRKNEAYKFIELISFRSYPLI